MSCASIGYPAAITLALENLFDNAVCHTPSGTAIVVQDEPGPRLAVAADGDGVALEHLARLKYRFWRVDDSPSEGSGIGLSIVDRAARAHYGVLHVSPGDDDRELRFEMRLESQYSS